MSRLISELQGSRHVEERPALWKSMPEIVLQQAEDAAFALLDGRSVLFSEARQKIYELDQVGAYIWCRFAEQAPSAVICSELGRFGIDVSRASGFVRQALNEWLDLALLDVRWRISTDFTLRASLGEHKICIRALNGELLQRLTPLFCTLLHGQGDDDITVEVIELDNQIFFRGDCGRLHRCDADGLAPAVKAYLTERTIRSGHSIFALHAASLTKDQKGIILCGDPGVGKSTVTLRLIDAGFRYAGDDVALIGADGMISGIPFSLGIKPGSWELLSRLRSDLVDLVTYRRPDGIRVRYAPVADVCKEAFSTGWIIFLNRGAGGLARLTPLAQVDAMRRIVEGAFVPNGRLSHGGFLALKRMTTDARSFELTYSESAEALRLLINLCHDRS